MLVELFQSFHLQEQVEVVKPKAIGSSVSPWVSKPRW